jgi:endonuclease YncB( thermonuclease family)
MLSLLLVIAGMATVQDGDSLKIAGERIRLEGVDAPELNQRCFRGGAVWECGKESRDYLKMITQGQVIRCNYEKRDQYGRILGYCSNASYNLNVEMIAGGMAVAYRRYDPPEEILAAEDWARAHGKGLWQSDFTSPEQWRRDHPRR